MLKLTVKWRIVLLLVVVLVVPLTVANGIWLLSSQSELRSAASSQQGLVVKSSANAVTDFINETLNAAIIHSQTPEVVNMQLAQAEPELVSYFKQDSDLTRVALVDAGGTQRLVVTPDGASTKPVNVATDDAFRVVTFLGGEDYISPVTFDQGHAGYITVAVPLANGAGAQTSTYLSSTQPSVVLPPSAIKGALIVTIALNKLWSSALNGSQGHGGYAYVVDNQGNLISYPDAKFIKDHERLANVAEVRSALSTAPSVPGAVPAAPAPHETISETGVRVLSSHYQVARTGWIVVMEEPVSNVYAPVNNDLKVAASFFALSCLVGLLLVWLTARNLLTPIRALTEGAGRFAKRDLAFRIPMARSDEFGLLARTFNDMADNISDDIAKLQDTDSLKNEFISIASHNLRTPLTLINGYIDIMKESPQESEMAHILDGIAGSAHELLRFSEDMLTISTIESGYAVLDIDSIEVGALLKPVRLEFEPRAVKKGIELVWRLPDPATAVRLSPVHIRAALANLINNALEFTPQGGRVEVELAINEKQYVITVRDNGAGIGAEEVPRLFTKFHRGTGLLQYDHPGTGIGLYVTGLIVDAHRGHISVRSQLGHGSTFTITLPIQ